MSTPCFILRREMKGNKNMKQAILTVSFGTSYHDTLKVTIAAAEEALAKAFPQWEVRRAFTSGMIIRKLKKRDGLVIDNTAEAMERLEKEGFTHVLVQPTHVMHGEEYEKMLAQLAPWRKRLCIEVGSPLLNSLEDYEEAAEGLLGWLPKPAEDEALVFMGHGTVHFANACYSQMENVMQKLCDRVFIATVEGYPMLEDVLSQLKKRPEIRRVTLAPFMLVAGDHAKNDMAGEDEDSWKSQLAQAGYEVNCILRGMGECEAIRRMFVRHCQEAMERLPQRGKLWGVGVGPGDPELLTLKAVRVIKGADVVMVPDTSRSERAAESIVSPYLEGKEIVAVKTPMVRDKSVVDAAYEEAARQICQRLDRGESVAFLTLGDPTIYSTYMYIHEKVKAKGYEVEVVSGIPSFCAAAARLNISLCQGREPLLIVPASHDPEHLMEIEANRVFMKAGSSILELQELLEKYGMLEGASMVENCSMENEAVYPEFSQLEEPTGYFSLVIAKGNKGEKP